jgi:hypothetical protein
MFKPDAQNLRITLRRHFRQIAVVFLASGVCGCAAFREEIPQILYRAQLVEPADMQICDELSHDMVAQEGLTVTTQANPLLPKSSCSATLRADGLRGYGEVLPSK